MSIATLSIRAHFDGRFIVPDEPVSLPVDAPLNIEVRAVNSPAAFEKEAIKLKLAALERFTKQGEHGASIPDELLHRAAMYGDEER